MSGDFHDHKRAGHIRFLLSRAFLLSGGWLACPPIAVAATHWPAGERARAAGAPLREYYTPPSLTPHGQDRVDGRAPPHPARTVFKRANHLLANFAYRLKNCRGRGDPYHPSSGRRRSRLDQIHPSSSSSPDRRRRRCFCSFGFQRGNEFPNHRARPPSRAPRHPGRTNNEEDWDVLVCVCVFINFWSTYACSCIIAGDDGGV